MGNDTEIDTKLVNQTFLNKIASKDPVMQKEAQDAIDEYTRLVVREDGFLRRILPPMTITDDKLDRQVDTDKPVKIIDKEPFSPAAISVPFGSLPMNRYIRGPRYRIQFDRILGRKFTKDIEELRTYTMDIRQILSDNMIKDMLAEEDGKFIVAVNSLLVGAGSTVPETGAVQWQTITGGITRDTVSEAMKIMPRSSGRWNPATIVINQVSIWDFVKWDRLEAGGDLSQKLLETGFAETKMLGLRWIITIKRDLVPDGTVFMFAEPKALGKLYILEDVTMYVDRRAFMLEFFPYSCLGGAIGNVSGVARADFPIS